MKTPGGRTALKVLAGFLGAVLSVALVLTAFFRFDLSGVGPLLTPRFSFAAFTEELPRNIKWLIPFALLSAMVIPLRALQWQATLSKKVPYRERYHLVAIGAFIHNALPGKLGDISRAFFMARTQKMPFAESLGSVAVCKLLEFAALMLLVSASFFGPFAETMRRFSGALRVALPLCVGLVVAVIALAHYSKPLAATLRRKQKLPKLEAFLEQVSGGLGTARSVKGLAFALLLSIGPVLAPAIAYGVGLSGLGISGGIFAGAVVLGAIALGQATPGLPAGMGIYYLVTSWAARSLGATAEQAAAYSALTHLATLSTQLIVGGTSVWVRKLRWKDLRARQHLAKEEMRHVAEHVAEPARA